MIQTRDRITERNSDVFDETSVTSTGEKNYNLKDMPIPSEYQSEFEEFYNENWKSLRDSINDTLDASRTQISLDLLDYADFINQTTNPDNSTLLVMDKELLEKDFDLAQLRLYNHLTQRTTCFSALLRHHVATTCLMCSQEYVDSYTVNMDLVQIAA